MWAIVETIENKKNVVHAYPKQWIKENRLSWPMHLKTEKQIEEAKTKLQESDESWPTFKIRKILHNNIGKYLLRNLHFY